MFVPKNIGIFGEAEERHNKMIRRMEAMSVLLKYIETIEKYTDSSDSTAQTLMDEMLKIVIERFNEIEGVDDEIVDVVRD